MMITLTSFPDKSTVSTVDKTAALPATGPDTDAPATTKDTVLILLQDPANVAAVVQHFLLTDPAQIKALQTIAHGADAQDLLGIPNLAELENFLLLDPGSRKSFVFTTTPHTVSDAVSIAPAPEPNSSHLPDGPCTADPGVAVPISAPYVEPTTITVSASLPGGPCTADPGVALPISAPYIDPTTITVSGSLPDGLCTADSSAPVSGNEVPAPVNATGDDSTLPQTAAMLGGEDGAGSHVNGDDGVEMVELPDLGGTNVVRIVQTSLGPVNIRVIRTDAVAGGEISIYEAVGQGDMIAAGGGTPAVVVDLQVPTQYEAIYTSNGTSSRMTPASSEVVNGGTVRTFVLNNSDVHLNVDYLFSADGNPVPFDRVQAVPLPNVAAHPGAGGGGGGGGIHVGGGGGWGLPNVNWGAATSIGLSVAVVAGGASIAWALLDPDSLNDTLGATSDSPAAPGDDTAVPTPVDNTLTPATGAMLQGADGSAAQGGSGPANNGALIIPVAGNGGNEPAGNAAENPPGPAVTAIPPGDQANQITEHEFLNPGHHEGQEIPDGGGGGGGITIENLIGVSVGTGVIGGVIALLVLSSENENNDSNGNNNGFYPLVAPEEPAPGDHDVISHGLVVGLDSAAGVLAVGSLGTEAAQGGLLDPNPLEIGGNQNGGGPADEIPAPLNHAPEAIELVPVNADPEAAVPPAAPEADELEDLPEAPGVEWVFVIGGAIGSVVLGAGLAGLYFEVDGLVSEMENDHSHDAQAEQLNQVEQPPPSTDLALQSPVALSLAASPLINVAVAPPLHKGMADMMTANSVTLSFEFSPPSGDGGAANLIHHSHDTPAIQGVLAHWMASIDPGFAATVVAFEMLDYNWIGDGGVMLQLLVSDMPVIPDPTILMALQYAMQDYLTTPDHPASLNGMTSQALTLVGTTGLDGLI